MIISPPKKKLSFIWIILILLISHITINTIINNIILNYLGILIITLILLIYTNYIKDTFLIILLFYILSYYEFAYIRGGLYNICFFVILLVSQNINIRYIKGHPLLLLCAVIILVSHILGTFIKGLTSIDAIFIGTITLISYLAAFIILSSIKISKNNFGLFVRISTMMIILMFLSQLNSKYGIIRINSPLIGYSEVHNRAAIFFPSFMANSPLTAEYAFMNFTLGLSILTTIKNKKNFNLNNYILFTYTVISVFVMLLTTNRSTVFLSFAAILLIIFVNIEKISLTSLWILPFIIITIYSVINFSNLLGIDLLIDRLYEIDYQSTTMESVTTGESINRSTAFDLGKDMIKRENWLIGYGWSTYPNNRVAWFGTAKQQRADPHSLYYSLPMLFGWIGSLAFLILITSPIWFGLFKLHRSSLYDAETRRIGWIFVLVFILFMINEYKQAFLISANYFFLIMIWSGLAVSIQINGFREE